MTLRQKTLLGETYVEITPGDPQSPAIPDGGKLPVGNIQPTVELDEIIQIVRRAHARGVRRPGSRSSRSAAPGAARTSTTSSRSCRRSSSSRRSCSSVLNDNEAGLSALVSNTGKVFNALERAQRPAPGPDQEHQHASSRRPPTRNQQLAQTFVAFPTFERESRLLIARTAAVRQDDEPADRRADAGRRRSSARRCRRSQGFAPELSNLMHGPRARCRTRRVKGLPAVNSFLKDATPFFGALDPALTQLNPLLQFIGAYPGELTAFFANIVAAASQARTNLNGVNVELRAHDDAAQPGGPRAVPDARSSPTATRRTTSRAR